MPTISIITTCCNDLDELITTCNSIDNQTELPFEHWIINSSSGFQIEEWLKNNAQPAYRKWVHESGKHTTDARNFGINLAKGEIIHQISSGDKYYDDNVIKIVMNEFESDNSLKWINSKLILRSNLKELVLGQKFEFKNLYKGINGVYQPTWFIKKEVFTMVGLYDKDLIYAKDFDMLCRISNQNHKYIDKVLIEYFDWGYNKEHYYNFLKDNLKVYESYFGKSKKAVLWFLFSKLKFKLFS